MTSEAGNRCFIFIGSRVPKSDAQKRLIPAAEARRVTSTNEGAHDRFLDLRMTCGSPTRTTNLSTTNSMRSGETNPRIRMGTTKQRNSHRTS